MDTPVDMSLLGGNEDQRPALVGEIRIFSGGSDIFLVGLIQGGNGAVGRRRVLVFGLVM